MFWRRAKNRLGAPRGRMLAVLGAVAFAALAGGVAWATIPGGDGVIHGCYLKSGGNLRVIDSSVTNCKKTETALDWSVAGPQGPQGEPGQQGATGPQGDPGPAGPGAGYTDFHAGAGGVGAIELPQPGSPAVRVLTLNIPDDWAQDQPGVVAIASVQFTNQGDVFAHPGCTVLSDRGGFGDGHTYVESRTEGLKTDGQLTFQAPSRPEQPGPPSEIWLECGLGSDHPPIPPDGSLDVRVLNAEITVIPRSF